MQIITRRIPSLGALVCAGVALTACSSYGGQQPDETVSAGYDNTASAEITVGPPDLPVYDQPPCPGDGYMWTPGYWGYASADYYWVPGTWVEPPQVGFLWTPGYWGWGGGGYLFHDGYWGESVGFYGGINYGFGYSGVGFEGGRWDNGHFAYNRSVANIDVNVEHNVYNTTVENNTSNRVSYNGGTGGVTARATSAEEAAGRGTHLPPVAAQIQHAQTARGNEQQRASVNNGKPAIAATPKAGAFGDAGVVAAKEGGTVHTAALPTKSAPAVHPKDLPPVEHAAAPNTGDAQLDKQYQQQQDKLAAQQTSDRAKLQAKQDQEHQQLAQKKADPVATQKLEQKHQQQTQQLAQRHTQQSQALRTRQQPSQPRAVAARNRG